MGRNVACPLFCVAVITVDVEGYGVSVEFVSCWFF